MFDDIYNKIYPSTEAVFMEEAGRNIELILKDKIKSVYRSGSELLIEVAKENIRDVIEELKENPELNVNSFRNINTYRSNDKNFMIINLSSTEKVFSVLLKVKISDTEAERNYFEIIDILKGFYRAAEFYQYRDKKVLDNANVKIRQGFLDGLDFFDMAIYADGDEVKEAYINIDISRVVDRQYYKGMKVFNLIAYVSRFDWKAGIFPEICFCRAVEEILQLEVPERAQYIRILLGELYRISNHIYFISNICNVLEHDVAYSLSLLERERILRIIETLTGSRIVPNFIRVGGVQKDISGEVIHNIKRSLPTFLKNIRKIEKMIMNDFMVIERLKDVGIISKEEALEAGLSGPNLRASGVRFDLRKDKDHVYYRDLSFSVPAGRKGDCLDRVSVRFAEMYQSLRLLNQVIDKIPGGSFIKKINIANLEFQPGSVSSGIECPHGIFKVYLEVEKREIKSLIIMGPSLNSLILSEQVLRGSKIEDIELILMSMDISPGEIISV
jgi:NADH-quinone oxidoreductase subunit D